MSLEQPAGRPSDAWSQQQLQRAPQATAARHASPFYWIGTMHWSGNLRSWLGLIQISDTNQATVMHELVWRKLSPEAVALQFFLKLVEIGLTEPPMVIAPSSIYPKREDKPGGETVSETLMRCGLPLERGDDLELEAGWVRLRAWFSAVQQSDGSTAPSLRIHERCKRLLRAIPSAVEKSSNPDDIDNTESMFPLHALRRFVMSRPLPPLAEPPPPKPGTVGELVEQMRNDASR